MPAIAAKTVSSESARLQDLQSAGMDVLRTASKTGKSSRTCSSVPLPQQLDPAPVMAEPVPHFAEDFQDFQQ